MSTELTSIELAQLERAEARIEKGMQTFVDVGEALAEIRNNKLYLEDYKSFEVYCEARWGFTKSFANYQIKAADVVDRIDNNCCQAPATESQARPLTKLKPDEQVEAWQEVLDTAPDGKVTAKHVEKVVAKRVPPKPPAEAKPKADAPVRVQSREPGEDAPPRANGKEVFTIKERKRAAKKLGEFIRILGRSPAMWAKCSSYCEALIDVVEGRE